MSKFWSYATNFHREFNLSAFPLGISHAIEDNLAESVVLGCKDIFPDSLTILQHLSYNIPARS